MSKSRQKRKRDRRRFLAGAGDRDVHPFRFGGVLGTSPAHPGRDNLRLIRQAINQDWPMNAAKRAALVAHILAVLSECNDERSILRAAMCGVAMDRANLRALKRLLKNQRNSP